MSSCVFDCKKKKSVLKFWTALCMCLLCISEHRAAFVLNIINWLVFITEMKSAYCAVRTGSLNKTLRFAGFSALRSGFQYQANPCKICGRQSGSRTSSSLSSSTFPRKCLSHCCILVATYTRAGQIQPTRRPHNSFSTRLRAALVCVCVSVCVCVYIYIHTYMHTYIYVEEWWE